MVGTDSEEEQEVIVPESDSEEQCMHPVASEWKERKRWDTELVGMLGEWKAGLLCFFVGRKSRVGGWKSGMGWDGSDLTRIGCVGCLG